MQAGKKNKAIVFGVFDGLHDGHRFFLAEAKTKAEYLIAVVAPDEAVFKLKGRQPIFSLEERMDILKREKLSNMVIAGDEEPGVWSAIAKLRPDIIVLGYDQKDLQDALLEWTKWQTWPIEIIFVSSHSPETLHSRFILKEKAR